MIAALLVLLTLAADGPLRDGPRAPRLEHHLIATSEQKPCTFEQRGFDDPRVGVQWLARCDQLRGVWLVYEHDVALVGLFAQFWTDTVLSFTPTAAAAFSRATPPTAVPPRALAALDALKQPVTDFVRLAVDPRDGAVLGHGYQRGYVRLKAGTAQPLFEGPLPPGTNTPARAVFFDSDATVKPPWLAYAPDPHHNVELRLRAPNGEERLIYQRPPRSTGGNYRVDLVDALRAPGATLPVMSLLADRDLLLFTPNPDAGFNRHLLAAPRLGLPTELPPGETGAPHPDGPACPDTPRVEVQEQWFDPQLFEWRGKIYVAAVSETTREGLRFGVVPLAGATVAQDRLSCGWIVDTRESEVALVLGEVTSQGVRERVRTSIEILPGMTFHGSTNALVRQGERLGVLSSSNGLITFTSFELSAL